MGPLAFAECHPVQSENKSCQQPNVITVESRLSVQAVQHHTARGHGQLPPPNPGICHSVAENVSGPRQGWGPVRVQSPILFITIIAPNHGPDNFWSP